MSSAAPAPASTIPTAPVVPEVQPARALARAGALTGAFLVLVGSLAGSGGGQGWIADLPWMALFSAAGLLLAALAAALIDRIFLPGGMRPLLARGNLAAAITSAAHRIACGIIAGSCLYGADLPTLGVGTVFFTIGVFTLLVFQLLHRRLTRYADDQEIRGENAAVALSNAGLGIALAIIVGHAAEGSFAGWGQSLRGYAVALALAVALYPVRQLFVKGLVLRFPLAWRGHLLDQEIAERRNHVVGAIEGLLYIATALLVTAVV